MSTTVTPGSATSLPESLNVDSAARAFEGLLFTKEPGETEPPTDRQPEQQHPEPPKKKEKAGKVAAEQAPAAPAEEEESSNTESEQEPEAPDAESEEEPAVAAQPETYTVKVDGQEVTVTRDELLNGYSRTQDYTRKTMELAERRKQWEATEVAAVRQQQEHYRQAVSAMRQYLESQTKEPDWATLRLTLPLDEYVARKDEWDANQKRVTALRAEEARIAEEQQQHAAEGFKAYLAEQRQRLIEADPDFGDPVKGKVLTEELSAFALSKGFAPDEVRQVTDPRLVLLLRDAMRYQQQQSKAQTIRNKIESVPATAAPGSSATSRPKSNKAQRAFSRLQETGRTEDAAAVFESILD